MGTYGKSSLIAALCAVVVGAGLAWRHIPAEPTRSGSEAPMPTKRSSVPKAMPASAPSPLAVPASVAASSRTLKEQVENLLATHDPKDAYTAYFLVKACTMFNRDVEFKLSDSNGNKREMSATERQQLTKMCSGMTERERQSRLDYLAEAVKGGVPMSAWTFASEGPFGDHSALETRPEDPLVKEWKVKAATQLTQAADSGDSVALIVWGLQLLNGSSLTPKDPVLGYGYLLAFGLIQAERIGPNDAGAQTYKDGSPLMTVFSRDLNPEQRAAALANAQLIAEKAKPQRS